MLGCEDKTVLILSIDEIEKRFENESICQGDVYNFYGQMLTTAGEYTHTIIAAGECDVLVTLTLIVNPTGYTEIEASICEGGSYEFFGETLTEAGTYTHIGETMLGCEDKTVLTLSIDEMEKRFENESICQGEVYDFYGQMLTIAGEYTHTIIAVGECDMLVTLTLMVNPTVYTEIEASICEGGSYEFFGETLTEAGEYTHIGETMLGCEDKTVLILSIDEMEKRFETESICQGDVYDFYGQMLTTAG
jgi:hypothetical protein